MFFEISLLKCADSLMSGCSCHVFSKFKLNVGADSIKFGAQNLSFGMLVTPNLASWEPSSDAGGLGSTRKETLGVQARMTESTPRVIGVAVGER